MSLFIATPTFSLPYKFIVPSFINETSPCSSVEGVDKSLAAVYKATAPPCPYKEISPFLELAYKC